MGASGPLVSNLDQELPSLGMHKLDVELRRGHNLAVRDRGGEGYQTDFTGQPSVQPSSKCVLIGRNVICLIRSAAITNVLVCCRGS